MKDEPDMSQAMREFEAAVTGLFEDSHARQELIDSQYERLRDRDQLNRFVLHRFMCRRGCQIATLFRYGITLCAVRDYKFSPGKNYAESVEEARVQSTIDGHRHWPAHVYDVEQLARFGPEASMSMVCRHVSKTVTAADALMIAERSRAGRPGRPTRFTM